MQVSLAAAWQTFFDGLELKQQIVTESADQPQARILLVVEFLYERPQDRENRGLLAAFLFGEKFG